MEDMQFSESQTRIRWTDELVGILNSKTSRRRKSAAAGLLERLAHPARLDALERLLLESHDDPWIRVSLFRVFVKRSLPISAATFGRLVDEFVRGLGPWHEWRFPVASFLVLGSLAGHEEESDRLLDQMDAGSLRRLLSVHGEFKVAGGHRTKIFKRLRDKGGLDAALAWKTLEFEPSQELALRDEKMSWEKLKSASDDEVQRWIEANHALVPDAIASLTLPSRWLLRLVPQEELADLATSVLYREDAEWRLAAHLLSRLDDAAAHIDRVLESEELPESKRDHLSALRLNIAGVNPTLELSAHTLWGTFLHNERLPKEWIHWACLHPKPEFQCIGVEALFAREGATGDPTFYEKALESEVLTRTCALRMPASRGDVEATAELMRVAQNHASPVVRAEALLSLQAARPSFEFVELSLASLSDTEIVADHYAPVVVAAAAALHREDGLDSESVLRRLVGAALGPVSNGASDALHDAIGTWVGDPPSYSRGTPWRRVYWE